MRLSPCHYPAYQRGGMKGFEREENACFFRFSSLVGHHISCGAVKSIRPSSKKKDKTIYLDFGWTALIAVAEGWVSCEIFLPFSGHAGPNMLPLPLEMKALYCSPSPSPEKVSDVNQRVYSTSQLEKQSIARSSGINRLMENSAGNCMDFPKRL